MYIDITSVLKSPRFSNLLSSPGTFLYSRPRTKKRDRDNPVAGHKSGHGTQIRTFSDKGTFSKKKSFYNEKFLFVGNMS